MENKSEATECLVDHFAAKEVTELDSSATVNQALQAMVSDNVSSLPVFDKESNTYLGWIDMRDLATFVMDVHDDTRDMGLAEVRARASEQLSRPVTELVDLSSLNPFDPVPLGESFANAVDKLAAGAHRVPIVDRDGGRVVNVISQSDMVGLLHAAYCQLSGSGAPTTVESLRLGYKEVVSVSASSSPSTAFRKLASLGISALPVRGDDGALLGNVSVADLRDMAAKQMMEFGCASVLQYVASRRSARAPVVSVTNTQSIGDVVRIMVTQRVHRVYVVDAVDATQLLGVISARDLLAQYNWGLMRGLPVTAAEGESGGDGSTTTTATAPAAAPASALTASEAYNRAMLFTQFLSDFPGSSCAPVTVAAAAPLKEVLDAMAQANVSAVAVEAPPATDGEGKGESKDASQGKTYLGWIDTRDVAAFVCDVQQRSLGEETELSLGDLKARAREELDTQAARVVNMSGADHFVSFPGDASALHALVALADGAHRVAITDCISGAITGVLSQSDVVRFLQKQQYRLGGKAGATLSALGLATKEVVSVNANSPPLRAYKKLLSRKLTALPVVVDSGELRTVISVTDVLPVLTQRALEFGTLSLMGYIRSVRDDALPPCVTVTADDTLGQVLNLLGEHSIHRLFVVDTGGRPISVVSLKDVLRTLSAEGQ